jgi:hypothetical protein
MKHTKMLLATVALAFVSGGVASAFAQGAPDDAAMMRRKPAVKSRYHENAAYRPLTVGRRAVRPAATAAAAVNGVGAAVAAPFNGVAAVGGPIGFGGAVVGGAVGGAATLATAPLGALLGGPVGISADPAPPLPIKARYARTGAVASTIDEGFSQDVPVDKSGPIYMIDTNGHNRVVTPFTLAAFPVAGAVSAATTPFRPAPVPHP